MKKDKVFNRTYNNLIEGFETGYPPKTNLELTGLIGLFELTFESSWKYLRELLLDSGINRKEINSPRSVLNHAYETGLISDQDAWLIAMKLRNNAVHMYDENLAKQSLKIIKEKIIPIFQELYKETIITNID